MNDRTSKQKTLRDAAQALADCMPKNTNALNGFHARDEVIELRRALESNAVETNGDQGLYCEQEHAHDPADGPMSAAVCLGCWNKLAQEVIELRKQVRPAVEPTRELTLHDFGYAPGNYTFKCHDCGQSAIGDKRALRCETCAAQALRENRRGAEKTPDLTGGEEEYRARMCLHPEFLPHPDGEICVSCGKTRVELKATELPLCDCDPDFGCKERDPKLWRCCQQEMEKRAEDPST